MQSWYTKPCGEILITRFNIIAVLAYVWNLMQVFLLILTWLVAAFGYKTREDWKKLVISYDNMCHVNFSNVAQKSLPLPGNLQDIWLNVMKIIDELHIKTA